MVTKYAKTSCTQKESLARMCIENGKHFAQPKRNLELTTVPDCTIYENSCKQENSRNAETTCEWKTESVLNTAVAVTRKTKHIHESNDRVKPKLDLRRSRWATNCKTLFPLEVRGCSIKNALIDSVPRVRLQHLMKWSSTVPAAV